MKKLVFLVGILSIALLAGAIKKRDNTVELWKELDRKGDMAFQNYEIEKACRYWQIAIRNNRDNVKTYNKLGISYLVLKEYGKARDILEKGLCLESNNPALNYNLALTCYYSGDIEIALGQCERLLVLNRGYPEANFLKGLCLEDMGRIEEAQAAYIEELNNNPGSRRAWQKVRGDKGQSDEG